MTVVALKPVARTRLNNLQNLYDLFETVGTTDKNEFCDLIDMCKQYGVSMSRFAQHFEVSDATVSRWVNKKAAPHRLVRPLILAWLRDQVGDLIETQKQTGAAVLSKRQVESV